MMLKLTSLDNARYVNILVFHSENTIVDLSSKQAVVINGLTILSKMMWHEEKNIRVVYYLPSKILSPPIGSESNS